MHNESQTSEKGLGAQIRRESGTFCPLSGVDVPAAPILYHDTVQHISDAQLDDISKSHNTGQLKVIKRHLGIEGHLTIEQHLIAKDHFTNQQYLMTKQHLRINT
jgi:hypothetical protein